MYSNNANRYILVNSSIRVLSSSSTENNHNSNYVFFIQQDVLPSAVGGRGGGGSSGGRLSGGISKGISFNKMSYHLGVAPEAGVVPEGGDLVA